MGVKKLEASLVPAGPAGGSSILASRVSIWVIGADAPGGVGPGGVGGNPTETNVVMPAPTETVWPPDVTIAMPSSTDMVVVPSAATTMVRMVTRIRSALRIWSLSLTKGHLSSRH